MYPRSSVILLSLVIAASMTTAARAQDPSPCVDYAPDYEEFLQPVLFDQNPDWLWDREQASAISADRYVRLGTPWNVLDLDDPTQPLPVPSSGSVDRPYGDILSDGEDFWVRQPEYLASWKVGTRLIPVGADELATGTTRAGIFIEEGYAQEMVYSDGELFFNLVADLDPYTKGDPVGIGTMDVSDPMNPRRAADLVSTADPNPWSPRVKAALLRTANQVLYYQDRSRMPHNRIVGLGTRGRTRGAVVFEFTLPFEAHDYVTNGHEMFATDGESGLLAVTGLDTARGTIRSQLRLPGLIENLVLHGDLLFVGFREDGLAVVDVSDPHRMVVLGQWVNYRDVRRVYFLGGQGFVETSRGLYRLDLADLPPFAPLGFASYGMEEPWPVWTGAAAPVPGTDALLVAHRNRLTTVRVTEQGTFETLADTVTGRSHRALAFSGETLLAQAGYGIYVYRRSPNGALNLTGVLYDFVHEIEFLGDQAIAIWAPTIYHRQRIRIFDFSDPTEPTSSPGIDMGLGTLWDLAVLEDQVVILGEDGIAILPVDNASAGGPVQRQLFNWVHINMAASDGYVYLGRKNDPRVDVYRFVNDLSLEFVVRMNVGGEPTALHVESGVLYVGTENSGMWAYDVRDPSEYSELGRIGAPNDIARIFTHEGWIVAGSSTALAFSPRACSDPAFVLDPNPIVLHETTRGTFLRARPETGSGGNLLVEFGASVGMNELVVYDVRGRRVDTIWAGSAESGARSIRWQADRLPRGVYFLRLRTERGPVVAKVALTR